ncbi:MAG TPA: ATP-binding protein [Pseudonocardiaceae bacterium]|jgi:anti-sigma regulatory factor (Ser/Thr protein kinase)|nr:ATP-binding protein [Pseudonocardiaceae bacterium]
MGYPVTPVNPEQYLVRLDLPPGPPPLSLLRDRIAASLPQQHAELIADIQLVATELITNAFLHGQPPVRFVLHDPTRDGLLRIEVTDRGPAMPELRHPDLRTPNGRGLLLVEAYSVKWGIATGPDGKTVWAELAVSARGR